MKNINKDRKIKKVEREQKGKTKMKKRKDEERNKRKRSMKEGWTKTNKKGK